MEPNAVSYPFSYDSETMLELSGLLQVVYPEDAVAVRVTGLSIVALAGGVKEIFCGIFWTAMDPVTGSAGAYLPSPGWEAVMVQVPPGWR